MFVVYRGDVDELVVFECLSLDGLYVSMFGFCKGDDVWIGVGGKYVL